MLETSHILYQSIQLIFVYCRLKRLPKTCLLAGCWWRLEAGVRVGDIDGCGSWVLFFRFLFPILAATVVIVSNTAPLLTEQFVVAFTTIVFIYQAFVNLCQDPWLLVCIDQCHHSNS